MSHLGVSLEDLLADYEATSARWEVFFIANPGAALVPTDIAGSKNIGELVWHIYAASFRHAQRLLGEEVSEVESLGAVHDIPAAFSLKDAAAGKVRQFLETATESTLEEPFEYRSQITQRLISGTKRKLCLHIMVHAIRHWAQIGTQVRLAGYPPGWPQDIVFSEVIR